jgi:hypothetical protein
MVMEAQLFDGTILEFPDGTDPAVIQQTAKNVTARLNQDGAQPQEPRTTANPILGFGSRAADLFGNVLEGGTRLVEKPIAELPEQYRPDISVVGEMSKFAKDISKRINYQPTTKLGELADNPLNAVPFIAERIITSSPDMMAAYAAMPVYIMGRTNEILNTRLQNDSKEYKDATISDLAASVSAAVLEAYLERFATRGLVKGSGPAGGSVAKRIGKETFIQSGTEGVEEGIGYLGGAAGTKKGVDPAELAQNVVEGAIVGGGLGASVQGGKEYFNRPGAPTPQVPPAAAPIPTSVPPSAPTPVVSPSGAQDYEAMMADIEGRPFTPTEEVRPSTNIEKLDEAFVWRKGDVDIPIQVVAEKLGTNAQGQREIIALVNGEEKVIPFNQIARNPSFKQTRPATPETFAPSMPEVTPRETTTVAPIVPATTPITPLSSSKEPEVTAKPAPEIKQATLLERIKEPDVQESLKRYAQESGWQQAGGQMIREVADDYSSPVIGRTQWLPNADWWLTRPVALRGDMDGAATRKAINKAYRGEKLGKNEKQMVEFLIQMHDFDMTEGDKQRAELEEKDRQTAEFNKQFEVPQTQEQAAATQADQQARIKAAEDAAIQADMDAQAERDRAEVARLSEQQAENFALGQTPAESLTGQQRISGLDDDIPFFSMERANAKPYTKQVVNDERVLNEKIDELTRINIRRAAINRRFATDKLKPLDQMEASSLMEKAKELEEDIDNLKWATRNLTAEKFLARAGDSLAKGEISQDVYDVVYDIFKKNPNLLEGLRLQIKKSAETEGNTNFQTAGEFLGRIVRLYKDTSGVENPAIIRHELTHSLEQVMSKDVKKRLVQEWRNKLDKAQKSERTPEGKAFFDALFVHLKNPTRQSFALASDQMPNKDYYQFMSPSEYWAVNAEKLMEAQLGGAWKKFQKFVRGLFESLKSLFGVDNKSTIHNVFNQVINGKRLGTTMLADMQMGAVPTKAMDVSKNDAFKKWFGKSKIVNPDGTPKVMYHSTFSDFEVPKTNYGSNEYRQWGFHVGSSEAAESRLDLKASEDRENREVNKNAAPNIIPVFVKSENPLRLDENRSGRWGVEDIMRSIMEKADAGELGNIPQNLVDDYFNDSLDIESAIGVKTEPGEIGYDPDAQERFWNDSEGWNPGEKSELLKVFLKQLGYDSIVYDNTYEGGGDSYILLDPNQIKSAIGNVKFSPKEKSITLSRQPIAPGRRNYAGAQAPLSNWNMPDNTKMDNFLYKIQDKYIDTKRMIKAIQDQGKDIADRWDTYLKEELYHGRTAKRTNDFLQKELLPIVQQMKKDNISVEQFDDYLHNRHAEERNIQVAKINPSLPDAGSGIATADANAYLNGLDPKSRAQLEGLAKKVDSIIKDTQKILVDSGLEDQNTIDAWNNTYKSYVPLMREDLDFSNKATGLGSGFSTKGGSTKRAVGSLKGVADIFANVAGQRERAIVRSEKARVGTSLYGLAIQNPNPGFWLPVNPDAIKDPIAMKQELVAMGVDPADADNLMQEPKQPYIDPVTGLVAYRVNPILRNSDNVFPVRINGKDRFIFFNPNDERSMRMATALKNLDAEQLGWALGGAAKLTRWLASVNTQYNPVFGAYNFIRDVGGAQFNLSTTPIAGEQAKVTAGVLPALSGIYRDLRAARSGKPTPSGEWTNLWEEYQREGGATGYRDQFSKNRDESSVIERELNNLNRGNIRKAVNSVFNWLSDYNDSMENAVRLSAYKVALDKGLSKERAASIAKNLTVNFNRKGERAQQMGALYAFYNASVQGTARLAETLKGPQGKKILAGGVLLGAVQALALSLAGFEEDEPSAFIKERNLVIPLPDGKYLAIPMPLGLHIIPNFGRITTEFALSGFKNPAKRTAEMLGVMLGAFNPIGNAGLSTQTIAPTLVDPIVGIFENRDTFGRPIAKEDRATNPTPGYTRSRDTASELSKGLSYFLNYATSGGSKYQKGWLSPTPDQLDYLFGQATGGIGREVMKTEQAITSLVTGEELPSYKVPLVGKFYGDTESQAAQSNRFYENVTKMANHENEIKGRQKNRESVTDYYNDNPEARLYSQANTIENEITKLNKQKKDMIARNAPKEQIKRVEERKTLIMKRFNDRVRKLENS